MKIIILILTFFLLQQRFYSQNKIVGIVNYYKSNDSSGKISMSTSDKQILLLNSRIHKIEIIQNGIVNKLETNDKGFFKTSINESDSIKIIINKKSELLKAIFKYKTIDLKDSLKINISDKKIAISRDSIAFPEFYSKYNEKQAFLDYNNSNKRFLIGGFVTEKSIHQKELIKKYTIRYDQLFGCEVMLSEMRIMYRYNEVMKKLIGIKYIW